MYIKRVTKYSVLDRITDVASVTSGRSKNIKPVFH